MYFMYTKAKIIHDHNRRIWEKVGSFERTQKRKFKYKIIKIIFAFMLLSAMEDKSYTKIIVYWNILFLFGKYWCYEMKAILCLVNK